MQPEFVRQIKKLCLSKINAARSELVTKRQGPCIHKTLHQNTIENKKENREPRNTGSEHAIAYRSCRSG